MSPGGTETTSVPTSLISARQLLNLIQDYTAVTWSCTISHCSTSSIRYPKPSPDEYCEFPSCIEQRLPLRRDHQILFLILVSKKIQGGKRNLQLPWVSISNYKVIPTEQPCTSKPQIIPIKNEADELKGRGKLHTSVSKVEIVLSNRFYQAHQGEQGEINCF